jgi:hypothetical protein
MAGCTEPPTGRLAGILNFRPTAAKAKARQCHKGCGGYRVHNTRLEAIKQPIM